MARGYGDETECVAQRLRVGAAVLYLGSVIGFTLAFADGMPTAAWVGFGVVALVVTTLAAATIVLFERIDSRAGTELGTTPPAASDGRQRVLVVADVGCEGPICARTFSREFVAGRTRRSSWSHRRSDRRCTT